MAPARFFTVPNWLLRDSDLTGRELLVLFTLMGRADADGKCWPSLALIAKEARCSSKNTVKAALAKLRARGLVTWEERRSESGDQASHLYQVNVVIPGGTFGPVDNPPGGGSTIDLPGSTIDRGVGQPLTGGGSTIDPEVNTIKKTQLKIVHEPSKPVDNSGGPGAPQRAAQPGFNQFWDTYPRKEARRAAEREWQQATRHTPPAVIIAGAQQYAAATQGTQTKYVKTAAAWLRDQRWEDQPAAVPPEQTRYATYAARHGPWIPIGLQDIPHLEIKARNAFAAHLNQGASVSEAETAAYQAAGLERIKNG